MDGNKKPICRSHRWHMLQRKEVQAHLGDTAGVIPDHRHQVSRKLCWWEVCLQFVKHTQHL